MSLHACIQSSLHKVDNKFQRALKIWSHVSNFCIIYVLLRLKLRSFKKSTSDFWNLPFSFSAMSRL